MLERFLEAYDAVLVLDTETTGISCRKDEIIQGAAEPVAGISFPAGK